MALIADSTRRRDENPCALGRLQISALKIPRPMYLRCSLPNLAVRLGKITPSPEIHRTQITIKASDTA